MVPIKRKFISIFLLMCAIALVVAASGCIKGEDEHDDNIVKGTDNNTYRQEEETIYNGNVNAITGTATNPTLVEFSEPVTITYIETYHWNGGRGVTPGTIALKGEDGTMYGPWQASGLKGQGGVNNAYWIVEPAATLKAGTYTVVDSDPSSWSTNAGMDNCGQTRIRYVPATAPTTPPEELIWDNGNVGAITGTAKNPTVVTFNKPVTITYLRTYHWNGARGATPGTIALKGNDGTLYGPWQATGTDGQGGVKNANWVVQPNVAIPAGTYTIVDSDPSTFATNSQANDVGMAYIKYTITS